VSLTVRGEEERDSGYEVRITGVFKNGGKGIKMPKAGHEHRM